MFLNIVFTLFMAFANADCDHSISMGAPGSKANGCIDFKKSYTIGHIRFYTFPKARKEKDIWPYEYYFFASTKETRDHLCQVLGNKKESPRSHIVEEEEQNLVFSQTTFSIKPIKKSLKVLACRIL